MNLYFTSNNPALKKLEPGDIVYRKADGVGFFVCESGNPEFVSLSRIGTHSIESFTAGEISETFRSETGVMMEISIPEEYGIKGKFSVIGKPGTAMEGTSVDYMRDVWSLLSKYERVHAVLKYGGGVVFGKTDMELLSKDGNVFSVRLEGRQIMFMPPDICDLVESKFSFGKPFTFSITRP